MVVQGGGGTSMHDEAAKKRCPEAHKIPDRNRFKGVDPPISVFQESAGG